MWHEHGGPGENELIYGLGGGTAGAYRNGSYKLIVGGQESQADGWSAQYPGSTVRLPAPAHVACDAQPCLFNVEEDEREVSAARGQGGEGGGERRVEEVQDGKKE